MYLYTLKILHYVSKLNFVANGVKFSVLENFIGSVFAPLSSAAHFYQHCITSLKLRFLVVD